MAHPVPHSCRDRRARGRVFDGTDHECQQFGWPTQATPRYDHTQLVANDSPTNMDNLTLLCKRHHHLSHEGGFHLTRGPSATLNFTRPDGQ